MILVNTVPNPNLLTPSVSKISHCENPKSFFGVFWVFLGVGVVQFFSEFRIQNRMILVNSVPNPKSVAPKLHKLSHHKVSINVARQTNEHRRNQPGKTNEISSRQKKVVTDRPTNGPTDIASYRDAWTHLKNRSKISFGLKSMNTCAIIHSFIHLLFSVHEMTLKQTLQNAARKVLRVQIVHVRADVRV